METSKLLITDEIRKKLRNDFPDEAYRQHPTKSFLTTLKAMYITERLNDVFGIGRWVITHEIALKTDDYVLMKGKLSLLDYDCEIPEQYGGHKTAGINTEIADGYKSAITDVLSKSASYLEIGIDMFKGKIKPGKPTTPKNEYPPEYEETDNPWLNKWNQTKTKEKPYYWEVVKEAKEKNLTIKDLRKHYKINKDVAKELETDLK